MSLDESKTSLLFHSRYGTAYLYSNGEFVDAGNGSWATYTPPNPFMKTEG
jgi:hypothetical protein